MNEIKRYARLNCATFDGREGCAIEGVCRYYRDTVKRCPYFEQYVLPADQALEERYKRMFARDDPSDGAPATDACESCGEPIRKRSNRQKYCCVCAAKNKRQAARERMRKQRTSN